MNWFDILNGPTYPLLVKEFWVSIEVYDEFAALAEERNVVLNDKSLKGKSRVETCLKEFKCTKIRYTVIGIDIAITQDNIAQLIGVENIGIVKHNSMDGTKFSSEIKENHFKNQNDYEKVKNLHLQFRLLFKIIISSLVLGEGSFDQILWDNKHFLWFMINDQPLNLSAYIFHHLCKSTRYLRSTIKRVFLMLGYSLSSFISVN